MFKKILIANRGEIACRIMCTAQQFGIQTVAIYSEADQHAMHVKHADEAFCVGPAASSQSYLNVDKILDVAKQTGAEAIHPGYGFLAENAEFAERCEQERLIFIGPPSSAIRAMGSKSAAKQLLEKVQVPLVPGYHGDKQDEKFLAEQAKKIGFPVLLKAALGGGGKGMRIVENAKEFSAALASAQREAQASFGDAKMLIEKYIVKPRHVEVQVFADQHGNCVHLFERDCSIQRRHQKIIEEAPAPGMTDELREAMTHAAIKAAKAINYVGAGTIEFLLDADDQFYFMEMNTRLQVEHPVTEMITGTDLVAWQLKVAAGEELPLSQDKINLHGHAFETRIYAEDPDNNFLPSIGHIHYLHEPTASKHVRIDTGIQQDDDISIHYDPMIAKLVVWGEDRQAALQQLQQALAEFNVLGVKSNLNFLRTIVAIDDFAKANLSTSFIPEHEKQLAPQETKTSQTALSLASLFSAIQQQTQQNRIAEQQQESNSPWFIADAWQANRAHKYTLFLQGEATFAVAIEYHHNDYTLTLPKHDYDDLINAKQKSKQTSLRISGQYNATNHELNATIAGRTLQARVIAYKNEITVIHNQTKHTFSYYDPSSKYSEDDISAGHLLSPMPGNVIAVMADKGKTVARGEALLIIEAMKMEHTIYAPQEGTVKEMPFTIGDLVAEGDELVIFEE